MRLFLAIQLPERTKRTLESAVQVWRRQGIRASWSRRENYHLTLVFLGEMEQPDKVISVMDQIQCEQFPLSFAPCGRFQSRRGDILWLGVQLTPALETLQSSLCRMLSQTGISLDLRPYRPHLTLARHLRHEDDLVFPGQLPSPFQVSSFSLMRSDLRPEGAHYTELYRKGLMA
jgi:2'-5' RNA ligase